MYSKTLAPLLILKILEIHSDEQHPLTREQIVQHLESEYGITLDRKTFFRHMQHLKELEDYEIRRITIKAHAGDKSAPAAFYLNNRTFSDIELRLIADALVGSPYLSQWETEDLVKRLSSLSGPQFRKTLSSHPFVGRGAKTESKELLLNLEIIDEAIAEHKQIRFDRLHTASDGKKKLSDQRDLVCTPVQHFVRGHQYILIGAKEQDGQSEAVAYDLSTITNVRKTDLPSKDIRSVSAFKNGVDWQKFLREHPQSIRLHGKPERCTFLCARWQIEDIKRCLGDDIRIRQLTDEENAAIRDISILAKKGDWMVEVSLVTDPHAAIQFAWERPSEVLLTAPRRAVRSLETRLRVQKRRYEQLKSLYGPNSKP